MERQTIAVLILAVALPAFARADDEGRRLTYVCDHGPARVVTYKDDTAQIATPDGDPITLRQRLSAEGFRYAARNRTLRGSGREVTWTAGNHAPVKCRVPDGR